MNAATAIAPAGIIPAGAVLPGTPAEAELPGHVSFTQIDCFATCPEQYRQRYVLRRPYVRSAALVVGSAVHTAIQHGLAAKMATGEDAPVDAFDDALAAAWSSTIAEGDVEWGGKAEGEHLDQAAALVRAYAEDVAPRVFPVAVEADVAVKLPGLSKVLVGRVDVVEAERLREVKTTAATQSQPMPSWRVQARLYQAALPRPVVWDQLVKTKTPKALAGDGVLEVEYSPAAAAGAVAIAAGVVREIERLWSLFGPDEAWPMMGASHPWACARCSARSVCAWGGAS